MEEPNSEDNDALKKKELSIKNSLARVQRCFESHSKPRMNPRAHPSARMKPHRKIDPLVTFENAIDDIDLDHIASMVKCIRELQPQHFEERPFDLGTSGYGGGNNVTYVGGFVEAIMPEFTDHILNVAGDAAVQAGWYPHPRHLGFRCIELLEYFTGGELLMHQDADSVYTMSLMLGKSGEFEGGEFIIKPRAWNRRQNASAIDAMPVQVVKPAHLGGVLFDSNAHHAVAPIKSGKRTVLAIELWAFHHVDITGLRPHAKFYEGKLRRPHLLSHKELQLTPHFRPSDMGISWSSLTLDSVLGTAQRAVAAAVGEGCNLGKNRQGGVNQFALGVMVGIACSLLLLYLFREPSPLPANMMPDKPSAAANSDPHTANVNAPCRAKEKKIQ